MSAEIIHRLHFAFTVTFHYLFPQLTMGLALLIVVLKTVALRTGSEVWDRAARSHCSLPVLRATDLSTTIRRARPMVSCGNR